MTEGTGRHDTVDEDRTCRMHAVLTGSGVLEYHRPRHPIKTDYPVDHGFAWVDAMESDAARKKMTYLQAIGYNTTFHVAVSPAIFAAVRDGVCEEDVTGHPYILRRGPRRGMRARVPSKKEVGAA